jgi:DNA-binding MarR family transcriptional regulator
MALEDDIKQSKFKNEYQKAVVNVLYTSHWVEAHHLQIFKPFGITSAQYNVLRILRGQFPKASTINLIIDRMLDRMSNASRIVDKLESKGLVIRKQCSDDRRAVDVIISQQGLDLLAKIDPVMDEWEKKLDVLTPEEAQMLNAFLDKMRLAHG